MKHITPEYIQNEINQIPPFRQEETLKHYIGLHISWKMKLHSVDSKENNQVKVTLTKEGVNGITTCSVNLLDYPELKVLRKDAEIYVRGTIEAIDYPCFRLKDVMLEYSEQNSTGSKNKTDQVDEPINNIPKQLIPTWLCRGLILAIVGGIVGLILQKGCLRVEPQSQSIVMENSSVNNLTQVAGDFNIQHTAGFSECPSTVLEIAELADRALSGKTKNCGDRSIYENLINCFDQTENLEIKRQIQRIKNDYRTSILVPSIDDVWSVCQYGAMIGNKCTKVEPLEGFISKNVVEQLDIENYPRCTTRARAASILRNIKTAPDNDKRDMNEVLETLVFIMSEDPSLLVSKLALDRYSQFTGFSPSDVFDFKNAIDNFNEKIKLGQPLLLPDYYFKTDE